MSKICPDQHKFRPTHSTSTQLLSVVDNIVYNMNRRKNTAAVLLDVENAFDKVWHDGLIHKLVQLEVPAQQVTTIRSYLLNRSFYVKVGDKISSAKGISVGVLQGSCLASYFFSLYINDMPPIHTAIQLPLQMIPSTTLVATPTMLLPTRSKGKSILFKHGLGTGEFLSFPPRRQR